MASTPQNGKISKDSAISIGLVIALVGAVLGAALWVTSSVNDVRTEFLPRMVNVEAKLNSISDSVTELKSSVGKVPGTADIMLLITQAIERHDSELRRWRTDVEKRLDALERK